MRETNKEFIKMCDCPEIQDGHKWQEGDRYLESEHVEFYCHGCMNKYWTEADYKSFEEIAVWLPCQDQLQEMVFNRYDGYRWLILDFAEWIGKYKDKISLTLEQLWLSFVMKELYKKQWTGENWEEANGRG